MSANTSRFSTSSKSVASFVIREGKPVKETAFENITGRQEIPDNESVDKFTLQAGFVALAYALSFGFMCFLGSLSNFTNSIAWGFNFLWASLAAMLIKFIVKHLHRTDLMTREYINGYQMDGISGSAFDIMIVAGVTAIKIDDIKKYILPIVIYLGICK